MPDLATVKQQNRLVLADGAAWYELIDGTKKRMNTKSPGPDAGAFWYSN